MTLYAPLINPSIPAFVLAAPNAIKRLTVNFTHNRAVGENVVQGIKMTIRAQNDADKTSEEFMATSYNCEKGQAIFTNCETSKVSFFQPGLYYKIQIAYTTDIEGTQVGNYSTVGITKCVGAEDSISLVLSSYNTDILESNSGNVYPNTFNYKATYINEDVPSEKVHYYRIKVENSARTILDSGWQFPNKDGSITFSINEDLDDFLVHTLTLEVRTINGLSLLQTYDIVNAVLPASAYEGAIIAYQDDEAIDNGFVHITLAGINSQLGHYRLIRRHEFETSWQEIAQFDLSIKEPDLSKYCWKDFCVEHGQTYWYAIQQCTLKEPRLFSEPIIANPVTVSFEHIFLSDNERQLRIVFNPAVSSFKETILEQKTDTIGSQFPFFSRNGNVRYKEIPLSGLISYWMDSDQYFGLSVEDLGLPLEQASRGSTSLRPSYRTDLDDINFKAERQFKLKVLEWLNNGKPKLFRSPAEGNYIIRLMNVSLSPNAQVNRMLHNFSATGYEIANATATDMNKNNVALQIQSFVNMPFQGEDSLEIMRQCKRMIFNLNKHALRQDFQANGQKLIQCISALYEGKGTVFFTKTDIDGIEQTYHISLDSSVTTPLELTTSGYAFSHIHSIWIEDIDNLNITLSAWILEEQIE